MARAIIPVVDAGNNIERTTLRPVVKNQHVRLNDAILIAGFPGPGLVGSMGVSYILEQ